MSAREVHVRVLLLIGALACLNLAVFVVRAW